MAIYAWNAGNGGDWNTAGNWLQNSVPGALDTAAFNLGFASYTVTGDATVALISVVSDAVTFDGQLNTAALTADGNAYVTLDSNALVVDSGAITFTAGTNLEVDGTLVTNSGSLDVAQVTGLNAYWADSGTIALNQLYVNSGATFAGSALTLNSGGSVTLDTSATFGGGTLTALGNASLFLFNAVGQTSGSLGVSEQVSVGGPSGSGLTLAADAGAALTMSGNIAGAGYVAVIGGDVAFTGANTYAGGTLVDNASLTLTAGAAGTGAVFLQNAILTTVADSVGNPGHETVVGASGADTVQVTAGALLVFGSNATSLSFQGGLGASTAVGGSGALIATGGSGGDILFGGASFHDVLTAGTGATTLVGGSGGLLTVANAADNVLVASGGNTTLSGAQSTGANVFFTQGFGSTTVQAGSGQSTVVANGAANAIFGVTGTQDVFLGGGVSELDFVQGFNGGTDNIIGFSAADQIALAGYTAGEAQTVLANEVVTAGNTILTLSDNTQIVLFGYTGLTASNFV